MVRVCLFCAQFFDDHASLDGKDEIEKLILPIKESEVNLNTTYFNRKNLANSGQAYQSSTVDDAHADNALQESVISTTDTLYEYIDIPSAKTRREMHPYWEVCFEYPINIRCIKVSVSSGNSKNTHLTIAILRDSMKDVKMNPNRLKNIAVVSKTFRLLDYTPTNKIKGSKVLLCTFQDVFWTLPEYGSGAAVRILLHGKHSLQLYNFEAYQGDEIIPTFDSPSTPLHKKNISSPVSDLMNPNTTSQTHHFVKSPDVEAHVKARSSHGVNDAWLKRILEAIGRAELRDIQALLDCVFNNVFVEDDHAEWSEVTKENCLDESVLLKDEPRVALSSLLSRLRTIEKWIQKKDLSKQHTLQSLWQSGWFHDFCVRFKESSAVIDNQCKIIAKHNEQNLKQRQVSCSWAQFIYIVDLVYLKLPGNISSILQYHRDFLADSIASVVYLVPQTQFSRTAPPESRSPPTSHAAYPVSVRGPRSLPLLSPATRSVASRNGRELSTSADHAQVNVLQRHPSEYYSVLQSRERKLRSFKRYCGLCCFHFPPVSCSNEVLFKNIVALRRRWDANLVSEEILKLEQSACYLNKVYVCSFCFQFFDPSVRNKVLEEAYSEVLSFCSLFLSY